MAVPLRNMPADLGRESFSPGADRFRYGYRTRRVRLPSGEVTEQQIPLTPEDLLDPQLGDVVVQGWLHGDTGSMLYEALKQHFEGIEDILVTFDMKMLWGIPGLPEPSPDIAVIRGFRRRGRDLKKLKTFDVVQEGVLPCFILEVVSPDDPEVRKNDYEKKVKIYEAAGVPEYFLLEPPQIEDAILLTGYRLGPDRLYRPVLPDATGFLLSETTRLLFGIAEDGQLRVLDADTRDPLILKRSEERAARKRAEAAREEAEAARTKAEEEVARLRAEVERLKREQGEE